MNHYEDFPYNVFCGSGEMHTTVINSLSKGLVRVSGRIAVCPIVSLWTILRFNKVYDNLIFPFVNTFLVRNGGLRNRGAVQMLRDQTCWVDSNNIPSVCCPEEETLVAERCLSCGRQQNTKDKVYAPLCINCDDARPGDYPWMARLFFRGVCFYFKDKDYLIPTLQIK